MRTVVAMFVGGDRLDFEADSFHYEAGRITIYKGSVSDKSREILGMIMEEKVLCVYFADAIAKGDDGPTRTGAAPTFGEQCEAEEWRKSHRPGEDAV